MSTDIKKDIGWYLSFPVIMLGFGIVMFGATIMALITGKSVARIIDSISEDFGEDL